MGQGNYTAVLFGVLDFDMSTLQIPDDIIQKKQIDCIDVFYDQLESLEKAMSPFVIRTSYECKHFYIGLAIAVDDEYLQQCWGIHDLDYQKIYASCGQRDGMYFADDYDDKTKYSSAFERIRALVRKFGVELPEGRFMLVRDWD